MTDHNDTRRWRPAAADLARSGVARLGYSPAGGQSQCHGNFHVTGPHCAAGASVSPIVTRPGPTVHFWNRHRPSKSKKKSILPPMVETNTAVTALPRASRINKSKPSTNIDPAAQPKCAQVLLNRHAVLFYASLVLRVALEALVDRASRCSQEYYNGS